MRKILLILVLLTGWFVIVNGQKMISKNGYIHFFSGTPLEDIEAHNRSVVSSFDTVIGDLQVLLLIKSFEFKKDLMKEHFNENYMESDKYPKSAFRGTILNIDSINFSNPGTYKTQVEGKLNIHGISRNVVIDGSIEVTDNQIIARSKFIISPEDYKIKIPAIVRNNIAKEIEVTVELPFSYNVL